MLVHDIPCSFRMDHACQKSEDESFTRSATVKHKMRATLKELTLLRSTVPHAWPDKGVVRHPYDGDHAVSNGSGTFVPALNNADPLSLSPTVRPFMFSTPTQRQIVMALHARTGTEDHSCIALRRAKRQNERLVSSLSLARTMNRQTAFKGPIQGLDGLHIRLRC